MADAKQNSKNTGNAKHTPLRMCILTREKLPKKELARFVYLADEKKMVFDQINKARGRGANLKKGLEFYDEAVRTGAFHRAFKTKVSPENLAEVRVAFANFLERETLKSADGKVSLRVKLVDKVNLG
jgi:predicted RNA-binding protein YlxR (DUF448 family)